MKGFDEALLSRDIDSLWFYAKDMIDNNIFGCDRLKILKKTCALGNLDCVVTICDLISGYDLLDDYCLTSVFFFRDTQIFDYIFQQVTENVEEYLCILIIKNIRENFDLVKHVLDGCWKYEYDYSELLVYCIFHESDSVLKFFLSQGFTKNETISVYDFYDRCKEDLRPLKRLMALYPTKDLKLKYIELLPNDYPRHYVGYVKPSPTTGEVLKLVESYENDPHNFSKQLAIELKIPSDEAQIFALVIFACDDFLTI